MSTLDEFDDVEPSVASGDEGAPPDDLTLDDLGDDKEINTPPPDEPEEGGPDKPAEEPEKVAPAPEPKKEPEAPPAKADAEKTNEEVLKYLGLDSTLKIKGKEYKLSEFSKEDLLATLQKGVRMNQIGNEYAARERALAEREKVVEANALEATRLHERYRPAPAPAPVETEPPDALKPSEYDSEDVKAIKAVGLSTWKQNQEQAKRLNQIESGLHARQTEAETDAFMDELQRHRADFPLASTEEIIAVRALRPDIPLRELVQRSDSIYGSEAHIEEVFKHRPELRKIYEDKFVQAYLARNSKAKVVVEKSSTGATRTAPATKPKVRSIEEAGQAARKFLANRAMEGEADND